MSKGLRIFFFIIFVLILLLISFLWKGRVFPEDTVGIIVFSSLLMLSFSVLFIEHYFTKPSDVLSSSIGILLLITPLRNNVLDFNLWYDIFYFYTIIIAIFSLTSLLFYNPEYDETILSNRISKALKDFVVRFGNSKILFSLLLFLTLVFYVKSETIYFFILFLYAGLILTDPWKYFIALDFFEKKESSQSIGKIFGVQSKNTFLVKVFDKHPAIKIFDFVEFKYSMDDKKENYKGLVLDNYLLNQEQWIKILVNAEIKNLFGNVNFNDCKEENVVYKIQNPPEQEYLKKFIGVVTENTTIERIRFQYNSKVEVFEGQLVEVFVRDKKILYQIVQGTLKKEQLEQKNETGVIIGEAIQLGIWQKEKGYFEKYGWVPSMNSPVYKASKIENVTLAEDEILVGSIPDTNYPVILNKVTAITHHLAILGVTGTGKSTFARNLIRNLMSPETKIICVDFTDEYKGKFADINPQNIIPESNAEAIFKNIDFIEQKVSENYNKDNKETFNKRRENEKEFYAAITNFLKSDEKLSIFELPDVSNTTGILEYTKTFFKVLFYIAKKEKSFGKRVCVVLEEAHTVIPEINFLGTGDKKSPSLINNISQIALQGRKYNIGFIVIAQRTANVSKTVLTQCNSIVAFQEFDKTSFDFLSNYFGQVISDMLPNLKFRQAVAAGKAFKSTVPIIFEVPEIIEPTDFHKIDTDDDVKNNN